MTKQGDKSDGSLKSGSSRRSRMGHAGQGGTMPRVMVVALLVIVAGGAALFWPRGGSVPKGIGEHQTVVATPESTGDETSPRSGDVDINDVGTTTLQPEQSHSDIPPQNPETQKAVDKPAQVKPVETQTQQAASKPPAQKPAVTKPKPQRPKPPATKIEPSSTGPYAVQVGALGQAVNADNEAARLKALGWDARVRAGNNSNGEMMFRVWIGYFSSRQVAQSFIDQNKKHLPSAIPVHR